MARSNQESIKMWQTSIVLGSQSPDWRAKLGNVVADVMPRSLGLLALILITLLPSQAQAISDRRDQPRQADIPEGTRPPTDIAPPRALKPTTKVMPGNTGLTGTRRSRTNPLDHLSKPYRRSGEEKGHRR